MKDKISIGLAIYLLILCFTLVVMNIGLQLNKIRSELDSFIYDYSYLILKNPDNQEKVSTTGLYLHDGYYCVWTKDRSLQEINRTDCHEVCHALIHGDFAGWDKEHFCS